MLWPPISLLWPPTVPPPLAPPRATSELLCQEVVGGGEDLHLAAVHEVQGGGVQDAGHVLGPLGRNAQELQRGDQRVGGDPAQAGHPEALERVGAVQRGVPGDLVGRVLAAVGVVVLQHLEAGLLEGLHHLLGRGQRGQPVAHLDALLDLHVPRVTRVVVVAHHPLVAREPAALLEHAGHLGEGLHLVRGVASGLDGVGHVKVPRIPGQLLEVALVQVANVVQTHLLVVLVPHVYLVLVDCYAFNRGLRENGHVSHGTAHATPNIKSLHSWFHPQPRAQMVFCPLNGLHEFLIPPARPKVERLPPAPLIEISYQVVEAVHHLLVLSLTRFYCFI
mmetsp:Transcript_34590/g.50555  ORF Transcript_34590/g.50555 Transcript_34590/m.50555 type:complete len:334 (+) Transcript_34590:614-1615(+)